MEFVVEVVDTLDYNVGYTSFEAFSISTLAKPRVKASMYMLVTPITAECRLVTSSTYSVPELG